MRGMVQVGVVAVALVATAPVGAELLYNDNWHEGDTVAFQMGNCGGECDAVVLTPQSYPFDVNYVYAMASGAGGGSAYLYVDVDVLGVSVNGAPDLDDRLGGVETAAVDLHAAQWFEVAMAQGELATIESGSFAVAFCFYAEQPFEPCNYVGLGADSGPWAPNGGYIYAASGMACSGFQTCTEIFPSTSQWYTNSQLTLNRNWIIRAADVQWTPGHGDDDDDTTPGDDDDTTSGDDDDDTTPGDDDTVGAVQVDGIDPASIDVGETPRFVITGTGFTADSEVFFTNLRVTQIDVEGPTEIEGVTPAGLAAGLYDVCVENPDGGSDCLLQGFEVEPADTDDPGGAEGCQCRVSATPVRPIAALLGLGAGLALLRYRRRR